MSRAAVLLVLLCGAAWGLGAEHLAFEWDDVRAWLPDLVVGWTFIGGGVAAARRRPDSRTGWLLVATGFAWFFGNAAGHGPPAVAWLGSTLMFVHRGLLVHAVLSFPTGRLSTVLDRVVVGGAYLLSVSPLARSDVATLVLGVSLVGVAWGGRSRVQGADRPFRGASLRAAVVVGGAVAGSGPLRVAVGGGRADEAVLLLYEGALCASVAVLLSGLLGARRSRTELEDLVVELTGPPHPSLRQALVRALGDPTAQVGHVSPEARGYVDAEGREVPLADGRDGRVTTWVETTAGSRVVLVHDAAVLDDPALVESVAAAADLAGVNARLRADVRARTAAVGASRRRLVEAGDEERARLLRRLEVGAGRHLDEARAGLDAAGAAAGAVGADLADRLAEARDQLEQASACLRDLARGLHPARLEREGLAAALDDLARSSVVPVTLDVAVDRLPHPVEVAAYYVCAEALANVAKHARASSVAMTVGRLDGRLRVSVVDDGVGGARRGGGSGLRGIADRVETAGGWTSLESPPGRGTRLLAELPVGDDTR